MGLHRLVTAPAIALAVLSSPTALAADPAADVLLAEVNAARAAVAAPPLERSRSLERSSTRWARRLARRGVLRHSGMEAERRRFRLLGEVLARQPGKRLSATVNVEAWLASPGHRAVLLDPALSHLGSGWARSRRATYWVVRLGAR